MAAVTIGGKKWDVDGAGIPCIITPGIPASISAQVPRARMDRRITRLGNEKTRLTAERDRIQGELDSVTQQETDMVVLRATATADP